MRRTWLAVGPCSGLGLTPPMGFSSWNAFSSNVTSAHIRNITQLLIDTGLAAKGYVYINVDEGWLKVRWPSCNVSVSAIVTSTADCGDGAFVLIAAFPGPRRQRQHVRRQGEVPRGHASAGRLDPPTGCAPDHACAERSRSPICAPSTPREAVRTIMLPMSPALLPYNHRQRCVLPLPLHGGCVGLHRPWLVGCVFVCRHTPPRVQRRRQGLGCT